MVYTFRLEIHKKNNILKIKKYVGYDLGRRAHKISAKNKDIIGVNRKGIRLDNVGFDCSFVSNFNASARG